MKARSPLKNIKCYFVYVLFQLNNYTLQNKWSKIWT